MDRGRRGLRGSEGCAIHVPGSIPGHRASGRGIARSLFSHLAERPRQGPPIPAG